MKILYVVTVGRSMTFFRYIINDLLDSGNVVDIACNQIDEIPYCFVEWGCKIHEISTSRNPKDTGNIVAIKEIRDIVMAGDYDIVHCHTPIAAACTRFACRKLRKEGLKVIYTAHGFHFYKGAQIKNWLVFYPIEKLCAHWTDVLITINKEDFALAKKHMHAISVEYVPGVGIDVNKFARTVADIEKKRESLGIPIDAYLMLSVGELNENKNHQIVMNAMAEIKDDKIHYAIAGKGHLDSYLKEKADNLGINGKLHLLGYRDDVDELYKIADVFILPSLREGLNVSLMEALASGVTCVASRIRGNTDFVDEESGMLFSDSKELCNIIKSIRDKGCGEINNDNVKNIYNYDYKRINKQMENIYQTILD